MTDRELTLALCELLGELPGWSWSTTGTYPPDRVGVFYGPIPDKPDMAVGVRVYGGSDDPLIYSPQRRVQLLIRGPRGDPSGADALADIAFAVLQGRQGGRVSFMQRQSFGPLGADTNGREERSENYIATLDNLEVIP